MKSPLSNLQKEAMRLSLNRDEKRAMHAALMERVHASTSQDAEGQRSRAGLYYFFSPQFAMPVAAFLIVALGGGTAFAAQGSLPGDALYSIKTNVSEPIRGALAFSVEDKIRFHSTVAQTRIEEAEVLASQNRLDTSIRAQLESNIDVHIAQRQEYANKLDEVNPGEGSKEVARYDTSITAHSDILAQLGAGSSSSTTRENSNAIAMKVRSSNSRFGYNASGNAYAVAKMPPAASNTEANPEATTLAIEAADMASTSGDIVAVSLMVAPSSSQGVEDNSRSAKNTQDENDSKKKQTSTERTARAYAKKATTTLEELRAKAATLKDVSEETEERLENRFGRIEDLIEEGNEELEREDYHDALESFEEALDREATLSAFIQAGIKFDKGILGNLLNNDSRWGDR